MQDQDKSKQELIDELAEMRRRVAALEASEAEWRRTEEALQVSEERFRLLVEAIPQPIWRSDADGNVIEFNRRWHEYTGQTVEEAKASGWTKALHPDEAAMVVNKVRAGITSGAAIEIVNRLRRASDGSYRWHLARAVPMNDRGGKIIGWFGCATDIDDQKRAQEALAERELQLLEAQEVASMGFYVCDLATGRWTSSPVLDRIFGIPADYERSVDGWANLVHPDERQAMLDYFLKEVVGEKRPFDREYGIVRYGDKQVRWVHGLGRLQFNADGQPISMLGTIQDITERKRAEEALQKAHDELEQRVKERTADLAKASENLDIFRKFAEASGEGFSMADLDGHLTYLNPALCQMLGVERPGDFLGKHFSICYSEETNRRGKQEIEPALMRDGYWQGELPMLSRQGTSIPTWHHTFVIRDERGSPLRLAVVITDITERKRAEEALRASEERFRVAFEDAPLGIVMTVGEGILVRANRTFCRLSGYTEEELIGKSVIDITHPEDREDTQALGTQVLAGANPGITMEKRYLKKHGGFFWGQIAVTAIHDRGGNVIFVLGIIEDITERKQAQEALAKEHRNLRHMLRSSDNERQLIAYEIHDGLAQQLAGAIMQLDAFDHLKESQPKQAADAYHAAITMLRQGQFETRRLIAGVRPPILDEEGIVEAVAHLIHELGREKGPKIEYRSRVDFDRLDPTLENAIYRIAQEGLTNACKHAKSETVWVSLLQRGDRVRIEIRDWGVGFDPKTVPKSHFGLEGIRQRARLLGGKCSIRSKAGKGTSISVDLPVVLRDEEVSTAWQ